MRADDARFRWPQLLVGLGLIVLGLALLFERTTGWEIEVSGLSGWWPLILVAIGAVKLAAAEDAKGRRAGLFLILLGGWLLVGSLRLFGLDYGDSWPLILVILGVVNLLYEERRRKRLFGAWLLALGLIFLIGTTGAFGLRLGSVWPLIIVAGGALLVARGVMEQRPENDEEVAR